jgi:NTE family protein
MQRVGLALGSGGARGLCQIPFIEALDDTGVRPSVIAGSSIGAVVGAFYAAGVSGARMEHLLSRVSLSDVGKMIDFSLRRKTGLIKGRGVEEFLYRYLPVHRFEDLTIPLKVVATDFWRRREVIFDKGNLVQALRCSISVPVIFQPVRTRDMVLIDGGAVNPLPYDLITGECDLVVAIDVCAGSKQPTGQSMPSMFQGIMTTLQIMQAAIVQAKMERSQPDIYVKPDVGHIQMLEFHLYDEILNAVTGDVDRFRAELARRIKGRTKSRLPRMSPT